MSEHHEAPFAIETAPDLSDVRLLEEHLYEFSVQVTGITDGKLLAVFLRDANSKVIGGAYGWTWGDTCYIRYFFVPAEMRNRGKGTRIMASIEQEAVSRKCKQIMLETHDFQAPGFYQKLGFEVACVVEGYPRGHRLLKMLKHLA